MNYRELEEVLGYDLPFFGDGPDASEPEILRRLSENDPNIRKLDVDCWDYGNANRLKEVGLAISNSAHLRSLSIGVEGMRDDDDVDDDDDEEEEEDDDDDDEDDDDDDDEFDPIPPFGVPSLILGLAENRSIEDFLLIGFHHSRMDLYKTLAPFFEHNHNLRSFIMHTCWQLRKRVPSLISALKKAHGLKMIEIHYNELEDSVAADIINGIRSMPRLHHLLVLDLGGNKIGQQGCRALRKLLKHPSCKIQCLIIDNNHLDNACMGILCGGLVLNTSIKLLHVGRQQFVTSSGWDGFFDLLFNSVCALESIYACQNDIGVNGVISLGDSLATSRKMKRIDLCWSRSITPVGWRGFFEGLTSPLCPLLELDISNCEINDEGALAIASALTESTSLEKLVMDHNRNITSSGWIKCFHIMEQTEIRLKHLDLSYNNIDDVGATMLVTILVKMSALDSVSLCGMTSISAVGYRKFADIVNPTISSSKLRVLILGRPEFSTTPPQIDDSVINCFADALINNTRLTTFSFYGYVLSEVGLSSLADCLYDKSSLVNTFRSNHTLQSVGYAWRMHNPDLQASLQMNDCKNKFEVARKKILTTHFGAIDASVRTIFSPMPFPTLPTALSWIGRDRREYSLMYHFLHSMPWPLDSMAMSSTE